MRLFLVLALAGVMLVARPSRAEDSAAAARKAADALATGLMSSPEAPTIRQVALLPFTEGAGISGLAPSVVAVLGARLAQVGASRSSIPTRSAPRMGEQKLQAMMGSRRVDDPELALKMGAHAVLTGSLDARRVARPDHRAADARRRRQGPRHRPGDGRRSAEDRRPPSRAPSRSRCARLSDGLAAGFSRLPGSGRYQRLAVLTFSEVGDRAQQKKLGTIVTAEVATNLRRDHGLFLAERARLGEVLSEMKLQEMTSPDPAQASRIGKMADAQALVMGSVAEAGDRYLVTARIIATQTGEALAAESVSVPEAGHDRHRQRRGGPPLPRRRRDAEPALPGLGQSYNRQPAKAIAFAAAEVALLGAALAYHLSGNAAWSDYRAVSAGAGGSPSAEATRLYDLADTRYATRNWLLVGGAAVWMVGLVDAWVSGVDGKALLGGGATAGAGAGARGRLVLSPTPAPEGDGVGLALAGRF